MENQKNEQKSNNLEMLKHLIPDYFQHKIDLDIYKKMVDSDNAKIKEIMQEDDLSEYSVDKYIAKLTIQHRQTMNEDKLLGVIKKMDRPDLIKTKEYVDMDMLEKAMYNGEIQAEELSDCMTTKEIPTLKVSIRKGA